MNTYYITDRLGEWQADKEYVESHAEWFVYKGSVRVASEYRHMYILKADAPE